MVGMGAAAGAARATPGTAMAIAMAAHKRAKVFGYIMSFSCHVAASWTVPRRMIDLSSSLSGEA
jgi:hypothetical protein